MTRISILSAVRNEEMHLAEMIASLQAQTYEEWELLLVDDGSTDGTLEVIGAFADSDPRVVLAGTQQARGKVSAFNRAFEASTGDLVCLLGGDDRIPSGALQARVDAFMGTQPLVEDILGLFKLRTFSEDKKFDGMVLPRGDAGSRSGGILTMSRALASKVFPIPDHLVAEDVFLGEACQSFDPQVIVRPDIVMEYRIHGGNTNPRHQAFEQMTISTHKRARAWEALLHDSRFSLPADQRARLEALWSAEQLRQRGDVLKLLRAPGVSIQDRLAIASKSRSILYGIRSRFYRYLSGWRGA